MAPPRRTIMRRRQREAAKKRREEAEGPRLRPRPATSTERSQKRRELARLRSQNQFHTNINMSTSEDDPAFAFVQVKDEPDENIADEVDGLASDHNEDVDDDQNYDYDHVDIDPMSIVKSEIATSDTEGPDDNFLAQKTNEKWVPHIDPARKGRKQICPFCPYKAKPHVLRSHIRKHTNTKEFKCPLCSFNTNYDTALRRHLKSLHPGDSDEEKKVKKVYVKRFRCSLCPYVTAHRHGLKSHMKGIHQDEKPHQCSFCDYKTKYSTALHRHRFTQHKNEVKELGEASKEFKCGSCDFVAFLNCELKQHERKHILKFRCKKCGYKTATEEELQEHNVIRHNIPNGAIKTLKDKPPSVKEIPTASQVIADNTDRMFKCKICEHESATYVAFLEHTKSHEKDEPYKCNLCGYETECKSTFLKHLQMEHEVSEDDLNNVKVFSEGIMSDIQASYMGSILSSRSPGRDSKGSISVS